MTKKDLTKKCKDLEAQNNALRDENESLWCMLDEIKKSSIDNHRKEFNETLSKQLLELHSLITTKPVKA